MSSIVKQSQLFGGAAVGSSIDQWRAAQLETLVTRHNRPFAEDAQKLFDSAIVDVGLERLAFTAEVMRRGLTVPFPNWLANPIFQQDHQARRGRARETMNPASAGERSMPDRTPYSIPIYATMEETSFGIRDEAVAAKSGIGLDTQAIAAFTRNINETVEFQSVIGSDLVVSGASAPGVFNAPNAATFPYTGGFAWTNPAHLPADKVTDVQNGITQLEANNRFGPGGYLLLLNGPYGRLMDNDYSTATGDITTIGKRLQMIGATTNGALQIIVSDAVPADRIAIISMETNVLDLVMGQTPTSVLWEDGPWGMNVAVLACMIMRVKSDYEGKSGIALGNLV